MRRWMFFTQADCVTIGTQVMREVRMFDEKLLNKAEALYIRCRLDEAFPLFMELAGAGCGRAMYFLGEYYNHGLGSIKDRNETEARYWHGKGAAVGELLSQLNLAYMEDPRSEERAVLCRGYFPSVVKAAEAGDIVAADELGDMYLYGFGVEKSGKQAVFWLEKGVEKGYWRSLNALGDMYRLGEEVEEDGKKALSLYRKAEEMHSREALTSIGFMYYAGQGVDFDEGKAFSYFRKAAGAGDLDALFMMGRCYMEGSAVEKDDRKAADCFKETADRGYPMGMWALGQSYLHGIGVQRDEKKAVALYQKAAGMNLAAAYSALAQCYRYGAGVTEDKAAAVEMYKQAFALGQVLRRMRSERCTLWEMKSFRMWQKRSDGMKKGLKWKRRPAGTIWESAMPRVSVRKSIGTRRWSTFTGRMPQSIPAHWNISRIICRSSCSKETALLRRSGFIMAERRR